MLYFIDCLPIVAAQFLISLRFKNFLVPVGVGFLAWVGALASLPWKFGYLIPYTYCMLNYVKDHPGGKAVIPSVDNSFVRDWLFCSLHWIGFLALRDEDREGIEWSPLWSHRSGEHMFPIGDDNEHSGLAFVTIGLIALNGLAFLLEISQPSDAHVQAFITAWGVVPREYSAGVDLPPRIPYPLWTTLLTSMFLHGGWGHLGGNMLFLWIFGDNIEHRIGHLRFIVFYLACGLAAGLAHIVFNSSSVIPTVGASGAISGILGGYLLLFPRNRVYVITWGGVATVPAIFMLGLWIVTQFINGVGEIARTDETGGVAYMAHIGGFVAGMVLAPLLAAGRASPQPRRS